MLKIKNLSVKEFNITKANLEYSANIYDDLEYLGDITRKKGIITITPKSSISQKTIENMIYRFYDCNIPLLDMIISKEKRQLIPKIDLVVFMFNELDSLKESLEKSILDLTKGKPHQEFTLVFDYLSESYTLVLGIHPLSKIKQYLDKYKNPYTLNIKDSSDIYLLVNESLYMN